jgi:hypothetical protein
VGDSVFFLSREHVVESVHVFFIIRNQNNKSSIFICDKDKAQKRRAGKCAPIRQPDVQ